MAGRNNRIQIAAMKRDHAKDLLELLSAESVPCEVPPGFYTVEQLALKTGIGRCTIASRIKSLATEKRMFRIRSGNVCRPVAHYRIT